MASAPQMLTTYLGMTMAHAVLERTVIDAGVPWDVLHRAAQEMRKEILFLRSIQKKGDAATTIEALQKHLDSSPKKKKAKSKRRKKK
jgi:hypothetical protein